MDGNTKKGAVFSSIISQWFHMTGFWTGLVILLPLVFSPDSSVFLSAAAWLLIVFLWTRFLWQIKYISSIYKRAGVCIALLVFTITTALLFPLANLFPFPVILLLLILLQDVLLSLPIYNKKKTLKKSACIQGAIFLLFFLSSWLYEKNLWFAAAAALRCMLYAFLENTTNCSKSRLSHAASYRLFCRTKEHIAVSGTLLALILSQFAWRKGISFFAAWCVLFYPLFLFFSNVFYLFFRISFAPSFVIGTVLQAVSGFLICFGSVQQNTVFLSLSSVMAVAGLGICYAALMQEDDCFCKLSNYLDCQHTNFSIKQNDAEPAALSLSIAVLFVLSNSFFILTAIWSATNILTLASLLLFFLFLGSAVWYAGCQPLDLQRYHKIELYLNQPSNVLRERLEQQLIKTYRRPAGFLALRWLASLFFPAKIKGCNNIPYQEPLVFVCNHLEIYGPLITCFHFPVPFCAWILINMLEKDLIVENLWGGVDKILHWLPLSIRQKVPHLIAPVILWIMNAVDHIPVYRGARRDVARTIRLSSDALECGDSLMLFPENTSAKGESGAYKEEGVSALYTGFASIASYHYNRTGKRVFFLPVYVNKKKKTITIGEAVPYDPSQKNAVEKKRLVQELHHAMEALSTEI